MIATKQISGIGRSSKEEGVYGTRLRVATAFALVLAVGLAACGNGDNNGQDEDQIKAAITRAATSPDPAVCTEVKAQRLNEQNSGGATGQAAVKQCEAEAATPVAQSVEVSNVEVDGSSGTAEVAAQGSLLNGQTINVGLVKEGDQWKLDQVTGFASFDRDAFLASFAQELRSDPETPAEAVDCVIDNLGKLSDQEVQSVFLGTANDQAEKQVFGPCFGGQ